VKGITDIFRTYLNSGCKRIIIPCFGYDPDKFLDNICTHAYRDGKRIKTHKIVGFNVGTDETEVLYEITIVEEKEKPKQKQYNKTGKLHKRSSESIEKTNRIVELRKEGKTLQEIGNAVGLTREGVRQRLKRLGEK
jgi:Fic family protein